MDGVLGFDDWVRQLGPKYMYKNLCKVQYISCRVFNNKHSSSDNKSSRSLEAASYKVENGDPRLVFSYYHS